MVDPNSCFRVTVLPNGRHNLFPTIYHTTTTQQFTVLNTYYQVIQPDFLTGASE